MQNKTIVITGTTSGIGSQTALALAKQGHTIYMLVRDVAKGEQEKAYIISQTQNNNIHVIQCDLASLTSVRKAADELKVKLTAIQVLINNAGGTFATRQLSADGFELTFALNHLGHFLLTLSLLPLLEKGRARVINVSSEAHKAAKLDFDDLQSEKDYKSIRVYGLAKLFNIYFAKSLSEKYFGRGITAYSLHPGIVNTSFGAEAKGLFKYMLMLARPFMITAEQGAATSVFLATQPNLGDFTGLYFKDKKLAKPTLLAEDLHAREKLWTISQQLVKAYL